MIGENEDHERSFALVTDSRVIVQDYRRGSPEKSNDWKFLSFAGRDRMCVR